MYSPSPDIYNTITTGIVMDTSDPQGKGRVRIYCADYGDLPGTKTEDLPWCRYLSPFGGMVTSDNMTRGPKGSKSSGSIAYGMWAIPKVGAVAAVMCLNGDPSRRIFVGCLPPDNAEHTMPHGRYLGDGSDGPLTSTEQPIEPLHSNMQKAFGGGSHEFHTRGADSSVTGLTQDSVDRGLTTSKQKDVKTGFKESRLHPDKKTDHTGQAFDSQVYSIVTPGFHAISMDDSADNGRIRIRTTCGHSIILDDTNERIYINTSEGNNWIEIDQDGTIDIYASKSVSINSDTDINFHAKKSIRLDAENIHLNATKNINGTATDNIDLTADIISNSGKSKFGVKTKTCDIKGSSISTSANSTSITSGMSLNLSGLATSISGGVSLTSSAPVILATTPVRLFDPLGPLSAITSLAKTGAALGKVAGAVSGVASAIKSAPQESIGQTMKAMPSEKLGEALNTMTPDELTNVVKAVPTDELKSVVNNIPVTDLKSMLDKLPGDSAGDILNAMPNDDVFDMFTNMPSFEVGSLLEKLPGESVGNLIKSMNAEGVGNPLSIIDSSKIGNILNSLPEDLISPTLESLPKNVLTNLNIGDIGSLIQKSPNGKISSFLPNDLLGLSLGSATADHASDILSKLTTEQLEKVIPHVPSSKIPQDEKYQSIYANQPQIDIGEIIDEMPEQVRPLFAQRRMTQADIGHTFRTMPIQAMSDIFRTMQPRNTNMLFKLMHGADIGHVMSNMVNPNSVLGMLESGVLFDIMGRMPGANIAKMFEGVAHGDIHSIFQLLGCGGIGNMLNNMPGGDILGTLGMYSRVLSSLPDMIANGFANFPNVADMLANALGDIPNVKEIIDDLMAQIPDIAGMLGTLQAMLMALPVTLSMPALHIPSLTGLLDMGADMLTQLTGIIADDITGALSGIANAATGAVANVAAAVEGVAAEAGEIVAEVGDIAGQLSHMAGTLPSLGMLGSMGGMLGAVTGMAGSTLDLNHMVGIAATLGKGQLNGLNGVGHLMGCMNGRSAGHVLSNAHPGDLGNLMYAIPNELMSGVLNKIPQEMLGGMMNSMMPHDLGTLFGKMGSSEIEGVLNLVSPSTASSVLGKMQGPRIAAPGDTKNAAYVTRKPGHEPWGRTYSAGDYDKSPKYSYDHPEVGKNGGKRNKYWRR